jgi:hypothetical protein
VAPGATLRQPALDVHDKRPHKHLDERPIEAGLLDERQLDLALREQKRTSNRLREILVNLGFVSLEATTHAPANLNIAYSYQRLGNPEQALHAYQSFLTSNSGTAERLQPLVMRRIVTLTTIVSERSTSPDTGRLPG